jgi:hypothetical protein
LSDGAIRNSKFEIRNCLFIGHSIF